MKKVLDMALVLCYIYPVLRYGIFFFGGKVKMSWETKPNDPVYPENYGDEFVKGLTIREYYAGLAMQGLLSNTSICDDYASIINVLTQESVKLADSLIKELNQ